MIEIEKKWKKRIEELDSQIQLAREEITMIQQSCDHNEYRLGMYSWRVGCMDIVKICNICDLPLTFRDSPTISQIEQFEKEDNQGQGHKVYANETDKKS